ncbi:EKC/KEOPS complex subunit GON7 [Erinaceus europaeus]|uniref:EKC/KEOPS complex subunit GON7 n=1 Tax=Erinaceus europaeus TaxID=9365 RepID=A0ABM3WK43_ERIEU|nr:EKC/KEOPS complex subunit GON7 [Erinaceus europaeus]
MELLGEYAGPDGRRRQLRASCGDPGAAEPLRGLLSGVAHMRELVAGLLGPRGAEDEDEPGDADGDGDDGGDENNIENRINSDGPSAKRPKPPTL